MIFKPFNYFALQVGHQIVFLQKKGLTKSEESNEYLFFLSFFFCDLKMITIYKANLTITASAESKESAEMPISRATSFMLTFSLPINCIITDVCLKFREQI